eukprot:SM000050S16984  [mRNA]  locus=s50:285952:286434:+ [translate_table: standard]
MPAVAMACWHCTHSGGPSGVAQLLAGSDCIEASREAGNWPPAAAVPPRGSWRAGPVLEQLRSWAGQLEETIVPIVLVTVAVHHHKLAPAHSSGGWPWHRCCVIRQVSQHTYLHLLLLALLFLRGI